MALANPACAEALLRERTYVSGSLEVDADKPLPHLRWQQVNPVDHEKVESEI